MGHAANRLKRTRENALKCSEGLDTVLPLVHNVARLRSGTGLLSP